MRRASVFAVAILALAGTAVAQQAKAPTKPAAAVQGTGLQADFAALVAAERGFAKLAGEKGIKASFLANIADDGILFRPGPVPGKEWLAAHPDPPALLAWHPVHAEIANSGDLGWTTGPYEITPQGRPKGYGEYSTIWRKQADGHWKFVLDFGIATPSPAPEGEPKLRSPEVSAGKTDAEAVRESMLAADRDLLKAATAQGLAAAYAAAVADQGYVLRDGHQPFVGGDAARGAFADDPGGLAWEVTGSGVSGAGDLGYVYGTASRKDPEESGVYMRVWRLQGNAWKISLDVMSLAAKKSTTPVKPPA